MTVYILDVVTSEVKLYTVDRVENTDTHIVLKADNRVKYLTRFTRNNDIEMYRLLRTEVI